MMNSTYVAIGLSFLCQGVDRCFQVNPGSASDSWIRTPPMDGITLGILLLHRLPISRVQILLHCQWTIHPHQPRVPPPNHKIFTIDSSTPLQCRVDQGIDIVPLFCPVMPTLGQRRAAEEDFSRYGDRIANRFSFSWPSVHLPAIEPRSPSLRALLSA